MRAETAAPGVAIRGTFLRDTMQASNPKFVSTKQTRGAITARPWRTLDIGLRSQRTSMPAAHVVALSSSRPSASVA